MPNTPIDLREAISPYVYHPEARSGMKLPQTLLITDCTAREGEQAASVSLSVEEKLGIFRRLDAMGVHQAQAGYPFKSKVDTETILALRGEGLKIKIEAIAQVFVEKWREEIDAAIAVQPDILDLQFPSSDMRLQHLIKASREEMIVRSVEAVRYAVGRGSIIRFAPTDTTRSDLDFLKRLYHSVLDAGVTRITIADTAGSASPWAIRFLVSEIVREFDVPVQIHCHNDFGLALANTLAAIEAGATIADVTVNGLGERAGNACLDELVVSLQVLHGVDLGVDMSALSELSQYVAGVTGMPTPVTKPLVGQNAFAHKLDGHVRGVMTYSPLYEPIPPETVGNRRHIPIGKYSGRFIIAHKLQERGVNADEAQVQEIAALVEQRAVAKKDSLTDPEFTDIVRRVCER